MGKSYDEIQKLFDKEMKRVNTFVAMSSEAQESNEKKEEGSKEKSKGSRKKMLGKKRAVERATTRIFKDDDIAIDAIPLATKPLVIVDYKLLKEGIIVHYQLIRADGSSKRYSSMIRLLQGIDKEDLQTLWKLVKTKHGDKRPEDENERVMWGDFKVMFEPDIRSKVWRDLQSYTVTVWKLYDSCGVHFVWFGNVHIFMLVEKRYPLTPITITNMLNKKLQTDHFNEMCYQLLKLMIQKMNIKFRGGLLGLKRLQGFLEVTTAQVLRNRSRIGINKWYQSFALRNFDLEDMEFESTNSGTTAKLPILKLGEYEMWVIRIKQYFQIQDYALWEVIENGDSWVSVPQTAQENGTSVTKMSIPVTAEEKTNKKNDVKARSLLLMALPNEHQLPIYKFFGACVFTDKWSLDELAYGVLMDGPYQNNPPSPDDIILSIRNDREGQVRRIRHEEEIDVHEYQILNREIVPTLKHLEEIIRENIFCLGYDRVMNPLAAQQERKTRKDRGKRRGRHSTSSSSAFDHPSSSHLNDDDDGNGEGTSRASTPSPIHYVNSLTNEVP
ncbi:hypothetical protein Tco_0184372 [Tanacetum coccineum]